MTHFKNGRNSEIDGNISINLRTVVYEMVADVATEFACVCKYITTLGFRCILNEIGPLEQRFPNCALRSPKDSRGTAKNFKMREGRTLWVKNQSGIKVPRN